MAIMKTQATISVEEKRNEFEEQAKKSSPGIVGEYISFLKQTGKWWLAPIILVMLFVGVLVVVGSTGGAPFIYALF